MKQDEARSGRERRRPRQACVAAIALASVALLAAACSGGSRSTGASGSHGASPGTATTGSLEYSQCMRAHGITNFPDPDSSGGIDINASSGINVNSSQYLAAAKACQSEQAGQKTQTQLEENYNAALKYAHCMQSRGVNIPDPAPPGTGPNTQSNSSPGSGTAGGNGFNPNSPQYLAANKVCQHYLPAGQGPSVNSSGGGS